jgi:hypothetical protein
MLDFFGYRKIVKLLIQIQEDINKMSVNQSQFDTALASLITALNQFIADYNVKAGVDLTTELGSVTNAISAIQAADPNAVPAPVIAPVAPSNS